MAQDLSLRVLGLEFDQQLTESGVLGGREVVLGLALGVDTTYKGDANRGI